MDLLYQHIFFCLVSILTFQVDTCLIYVMKCPNWHIFSERIGSEDKLYHWQQRKLTEHFGKTLTLLGFHILNQTETVHRFIFITRSLITHHISMTW